MKTKAEMENLLAARDILRNGISKSKEMAYTINQSGLRLEEMNQRLPELEASIKLMARKCEMNRFHVDHVIGPAAAVSSVFDVVNQLQKWVLAADPHNLCYVSKVKRLEDALSFLTQNCKLVILWLEDVAGLLENNAVLAQHDKYIYFSNHVGKSLRILRNMQAMEERSRLDGGLLNAAFTKLEMEFRHLLVQHTCPHKEQTSKTCTPTVSLLAYPLPVVEKLERILDRLAANNRLDRCASIYADVRTSNLHTTLKALDLDYLETTSLSEFDSVQSIESCIEKWSDHLEYVVKHVLELEYKASNVVFSKVVGLDVSKECFSNTVLRSGLLQGFIKFANTVTKGKKEAIKLLKLLDIFAALNKLRVDINRLLNGKTCAEIQTHLRDLIKKVINGACEIFWELPAQVESQRQATPPADGGIPRLVSFVANYSNELLSEYYRPILTQVLEIHWSWNNNYSHPEDLNQQKQFLLNNEEGHYKKIVKTLELNIQAWGRTYKDSTLSYIFLMNSHWYLCNNLKGTEIGDVMGDSWLRGQEACVEHYAAVFVRESWGKLVPLLSHQEDDYYGMVSGGGTMVSHYSVKKRRIKAFREAFDEMHRKQCSWVVPDKGLRWKICQLLVRAVVPVYSNFIEDYNQNLEEVEQAEKEGNNSPNLSGRRFVNYNRESLEDTLCSLFDPKLARKYGTSAKSRHLIGKIKNVVTNHFLSTSTAAA